MKKKLEKAKKLLQQLLDEFKQEKDPNKKYDIDFRIQTTICEIEILESIIKTTSDA